MKLVRKSFTLKDIDTSADDDGSFRALVSVFGVVDSQKEVLEPGAFTESLESFSDDSPLPILWNHKWDDIWSHIGSAIPEQTDDGLIVDAQLDLDNPTAAQAYKLLKTHRVKEFSIGGFEPPNDVTQDEDGVYHVSKFNLVEVSLTLKGANPDTELLGIKSGRILAGNYVDRLSAIQADLEALLEEVRRAPEDEDTDESDTGVESDDDENSDGDNVSSEVEDPEDSSSKGNTTLSPQLAARLDLALLSQKKGGVR